MRNVPARLEPVGVRRAARLSAGARGPGAGDATGSKGWREEHLRGAGLEPPVPAVVGPGDLAVGDGPETLALHDDVAARGSTDLTHEVMLPGAHPEEVGE